MYQLISEIFDENGEIESKRLELDFCRLNFIEPTGVTVLSNIIELVKKLGGDVTFCGHLIHVRAIQYLDDSQFFRRYIGNSLREAVRIRPTTAELTLVSHARSFGWIENDLMPWIEEKTGVRQASLASIKVCFQEVFNNIRDHSTVVEEFEMTMNRAAEDAAKEALPILRDAVTGMSVGDGFAILIGGERAATDYLIKQTSESLRAKFSPIVANSTKKVAITNYWTPLATSYNKGGAFTGAQAVDPDLDAYITQKAIDGLFALIAQEEAKIRQDPMARTSDLLRKVFGN